MSLIQLADSIGKLMMTLRHLTTIWRWFTSLSVCLLVHCQLAPLSTDHWQAWFMPFPLIRPFDKRHLQLYFAFALTLFRWGCVQVYVKGARLSRLPHSRQRPFSVGAQDISVDFRHLSVTWQSLLSVLCKVFAGLHQSQERRTPVTGAGSRERPTSDVGVNHRFAQCKGCCNFNQYLFP